MSKKFKLPKNVKTAWVKALRSGDFKQGQEALKTTDDDTDEVTYCCLGVACAVGLTKDAGDGTFVSHDFLPEPIQTKLAAWNDGMDMKDDQGNHPNPRAVHKTFRGIASWIEKHL